jgi:hypothetical protein
MAHVPLRDALPHLDLAAEDELRRLASMLDGHPVPAERTAWHWYSQRIEPPPYAPDGRLYLLVLDATITLYSTGDDWLELTVDIAWRTPQQLTVNTAVEVACWCPQRRVLTRQPLPEPSCINRLTKPIR